MEVYYHKLFINAYLWYLSPLSRKQKRMDTIKLILLCTLVTLFKHSWNILYPTNKDALISFRYWQEFSSLFESFLITLSLLLFFFSFSTYSEENPVPFYFFSFLILPSMFWLFGCLDSSGESYLVRAEMWANRGANRWCTS